MAFSYNYITRLILISTLFLFAIANARPLDSNSTLMARLKLDKTGKSDCWGSLFELQSCTGEIILFFLNGETYLGPGCCRAIRTIERDCWPTMLGSLGYTNEEGDLLQGYCDDADQPGSAAVAAVSGGPSYVVVP